MATYSPSPNGRVFIGSDRPIDGYTHGGKITAYACDACGELDPEPFTIMSRVLICQQCASEVFELYHWCRSGKYFSERYVPSNPEESTTEHVYLAHCSTGHHKIGWSKKPVERVKHFDVQMPVDIELIHHFEADDAREAERSLHRRFDHAHEHGEWYDLGKKEVSYIKSITGYSDGTFSFDD